MEELYTFNSQQLHKLSSQTLIEAPLNNFRKRVLSTKFEKKPARSTILLHKSKDKIGSKSLIGSMKKVQFKQTLLYLNQAKKSQIQDPVVCQPALIMFNKDKVIQNAIQETIKTRTIQEYTSPIKKYLNRAFSLTQRSKKKQSKVLLNETKNIQNLNNESNKKKSLSFRGSPKINVKLTNKKLPSDFQTKFGEKYIKKIKDKDIQIQNSRQLTERFRNDKKNQKDNDIILKQIKNINKMLMIEGKLFDQLYNPYKT